METARISQSLDGPGFEEPGNAVSFFCMSRYLLHLLIDLALILYKIRMPDKAANIQVFPYIPIDLLLIIRFNKYSSIVTYIGALLHVFKY
ncbi:hypothetical protein D3C81_832010 [compost metagenome]